MKKCSSCNIEFNIQDKHCPLCQNRLSGECKDLMYPKNIRYETTSLIIRILLFTSIVVFLIVGFIELMITKQLNVSSYVGLGLITNYIILYYIIKNYQNIYRMIGKYGIIIIFLLTIWFFMTKTKIITNYIIPSVCICELLFNLIVGIIISRNYIFKYSSQVLMNIILLILPMLFVWFGYTSNNILPYICCLLSIISIVGLLIFYYDDIKDELEKIFNV